MKWFRQCVPCWIVGAVGSGFLASPASAIEINISVDNPQSFPSFDPSGSKLNAIAQQAAKIWEPLRPGNQVYNINVHWADFVDDEHVAIANGFDNSIRVKIKKVDWFLDPTPAENSEFDNFVPTFFKDLSSSQKTSWFTNSSPPDYFEMGYIAGASVDSPAAGKTDLLSVMLHEIGHLTGIGKNIFSPDVPIKEQWVGGATVNIKRGDDAHLAPPMALMNKEGLTGRVFPSAMDVMANAMITGNSSVHLDRMYAINSGGWGQANTWLGGQAPDSKQHVLINTGVSVTASGLAAAQSLVLDDPADFSGKSRLTLNGFLAVSESALIDSELKIGPSGTLSANMIQLQNFGDTEVTMTGGLMLANRIEVQGGARLIGHGSIGVHQRFDNSGDLYVSEGTLMIDPSPGAVIDLDGPANVGLVRAQEGNFKFLPGKYSDLRGHMTIKEGHSVSFNDTLKVLGEIEFENGSADQVAEFRDTVADADLIFEQGGQLHVDFNAGAKVHVRSTDFRGDNALLINNDGVLNLTSKTTFRGGKQLSAKGTMIQNGTLAFEGMNQLDMQRLDLDGENENNLVVVRANASLALNARSIDADGKFNGELWVGENGLLEMNIGAGFVPNWTMDGTLTLSHGSEARGALLVNQGLIKTLDHVRAEISAPLVNHTDILLGAQSRLTLSSNAIINGGFVGAQPLIKDHTLLRTDRNLTVLEDTFISVGHFDWDGTAGIRGTTDIAPLKRLVIRAGEIGDLTQLSGSYGVGFSDVVNINSGQLDVLVGRDVVNGLNLDPVWRLNAQGELNLNHTSDVYLPTVKGSALGNLGTVRGEGRFENAVVNSGRIDVGPADHPGFIEFQQAFAQLSDGTLAFDLAGMTPKTGYDQLIVSGTMLLEGTAEIRMKAGFKPALGATFRVVDATAGSVQGAFGQMDFPLGVWETIYAPHAVDVRLAGLDPDSDYDMDSADLLILLSNWTGEENLGAAKTWQDGDTDQDGDVDSADLLDVLSDWTGADPANVPPAAIALAGGGIHRQPALAQVPEPAISIAGIVGGLLVAMNARRRAVA